MAVGTVKIRAAQTVLDMLHSSGALEEVFILRSTCPNWGKHIADIIVHGMHFGSSVVFDAIMVSHLFNHTGV